MNDNRKFQCSRCSSSFKRSEHLKRHQRCHEDLKRFGCSVCGKRFTRSDILARHASTHTDAPQVGHSIIADGNFQGRRRACTECARAREKCTKLSPCRRCSARSLLCIIPDSSRQDGQNCGTQDEDRVENTEGDTPVYLDANTSAPGQHPAVTTNIVAAAAPTSGHVEPTAMPSESITVSGAQSGSGNNPEDFSRISFQQDRQLRSSYQPYAMQSVLVAPNNFVYDTPVYDDDLEFPMNWLPTNEMADIDYSSILGLSFSPSTFQSGLEAFQYNGPAEAIPKEVEAPTSRRRQGSPSQSVTSQMATTSPLSAGSARPLPPSAIKGGLYATSTNGARTPCTVRARTKFLPVQIHNSAPQALIALDENLNTRDLAPRAFPELGRLSFENFNIDQPSNRAITSPVYEEIKEHFRILCLDSSPLYSVFVTADFPSIDHFNLFVALYFTYFAPILPVIHEPSFVINAYWPLALAVASIGCQYTQTHEFWSCVVPMHEFLRRALAVEWEKKANEPACTSFAQALVLSQVGMLYCGDSRLQDLATRQHGQLASLVRYDDFLKSSNNEANSTNSSSNTLMRWTRWTEAETRRRVGYSIWWLDCMMVFHFGTKAVLSLSHAQADLPHDGLWAAATEGEWNELYGMISRNPSLSSAVPQIFQDKQVKPDLGEFSRTILLQGVCHEIFQITDYYKRQLSSWIPSAQLPHSSNITDREQSNENTEANRSKWLTDVSIFSSWRNAALDCVDTLHWAANATIALLFGAEHPTVMHLHLSRIVLLVPYDEIITLALSVGSSTSLKTGRNCRPTRQEAIAAEHEILQWVQRDESKARLSALHSGTCYWHLRRYSTMAFYEPVSVFLATLALWAYGYYTPKVMAQMRNEVEDRSRSTSVSREVSLGRQATSVSPDQNSSLSEGNAPGSARERRTAGSRQSTYTSDPDPTFIRLDRPCDDEMVQLFVRSGRPQRMKAYITGVGDLCSPEGPARVLREGRKILGTVSLAWGRTRQYHDILEALEEAMVSRRQTERTSY